MFSERFLSLAVDTTSKNYLKINPTNEAGEGLAQHYIDKYRNSEENNNGNA